MRKHHVPTNPVARAIESTLRPGQFNSYTTGRSFTNALKIVEGQLKAFIAASEAVRAIPYYELFIAACVVTVW